MLEIAYKQTGLAGQLTPHDLRHFALSTLGGLCGKSCYPAHQANDSAPKNPYIPPLFENLVLDPAIGGESTEV